jgi:hypothetical protein
LRDSAVDRVLRIPSGSALFAHRQDSLRIHGEDDPKIGAMIMLGKAESRPGIPAPAD